ncbi:DUF5700 domain-containing putative Zn-dependent protease [Hymenobacter caeli]|uniref:DUF4932 domain-containing protein n=1 Tax=Hymenobacter caeli TaxID=2735894 RepID=A0ABX2FQM2_9BACT|nr:DUF5700 domain-containing putative Zn-dependent protease [Hymenobacter caeli]NRT19252.1 hypothetical protein [Hymenobacter caeli]
MTPLLPRWCLFAALLLAAAPARAQTVNVEAVTRYWEITDALRRNEPLTDQVWHDFLELPGNKVYVRSVYDAENLARYRKAVEVAYTPRYDSLLQAQIKAGAWYYILANDYKQREQEYRAYIAQTAKSAAYLDLMYASAYAWLPARNHTKVADLHLYYVALGNDATSQREGLFYSLHASTKYTKIKPGILEGHEMHHQLHPFKDFGTLDPADEGVVRMLQNIEEEGLADQVDKRCEMMTSDSLDTRDWLLAPAPAVIQKMDSLIQIQTRGGAPSSPKQYRRLTNGTNGHLPGFYMSSVIVKNGYAKQMIDHAGDPLAFVLLYQKAAKKNKAQAQRFSSASVSYFKQLARKYAKPRPAPVAALSNP